MKSLLIAFSTLTFLPTSPKIWTPRQLKLSVAYYPLAGLFIGTLLALTGKLSLTPELKALLVLLVWVLSTSAFHLDGLSDCLDGFFGGASPEGRRKIMKDPSLGAYGATGIFLALLFKYVLLSSLLGLGENGKWLLLIPLTARWALVLACSVFKAPPGDKGLGSQVVGLSALPFAISTALTAAFGFFLVSFASLGFFLLAAALALFVGLFSQSRIRGLTGDGMGALIELTEIACLFLACLLIHPGPLSL